jgi:hypothetical protein
MSHISFLLLNLVDGALLVGLIWTIQWVHYPSFSYIEPKLFSLFHDFHSQRITMIVAPLMLVELALAAYGLWAYRGEVWVWANAVLVAITWLSTIFIQIPLHKKLALGHEQGLIKLLVRSNYLRTCAWTGKIILLSWVFYREYR